MYIYIYKHNLLVLSQCTSGSSKHLVRCMCNMHSCLRYHLPTYNLGFGVSPQILKNTYGSRSHFAFTHCAGKFFSPHTYKLVSCILTTIGFRIQTVPTRWFIINNGNEITIKTCCHNNNDCQEILTERLFRIILLRFQIKFNLI